MPYNDLSVAVNKQLKLVTCGLEPEQSLIPFLTACYQQNFIKLEPNSGLSSHEILTISERFAKSQLITKTAVKERGWTEGMIARYLIQPDLLVVNYKYKSAAKVNLFVLEKVEILESKPEIKEQVNKTIASRIKRRENAKIKLEIEEELLDNYFKNVEPKIPFINTRELLQEVLDFYNTELFLRSYINHYIHLSTNSGVLYAACCRYLSRGYGVNFHELKRFKNVQRSSQLAELLQKRIKEEISTLYPDLRDKIKLLQQTNAIA